MFLNRSSECLDYRRILPQSNTLKKSCALADVWCRILCYFHGFAAQTLRRFKIIPEHLQWRLITFSSNNPFQDFVQSSIENAEMQNVSHIDHKAMPSSSAMVAVKMPRCTIGQKLSSYVSNQPPMTESRFMLMLYAWSRNRQFEMKKNNLYFFFFKVKVSH